MKCKKILSALLAVVMLLSMIPTAFAAVGDDNTTGQPVWPSEGAIHLDKTAQAIDGKTDQWEVTLSIEGKNYKTTSDVVLVIDNSNSMWNTATRMTNTKKAAKAFASKLLTEGSTTRIAVVVYCLDGYGTSTGFYTYETLSDFNTYIDGITQNEDHGGTNTQWGLHEADRILSSEASTGQLKNIVLLSDGMPTQSYQFTATATMINCWSLYGNHHEGSLSSIQYTGFDYDTPVGRGLEDEYNQVRNNVTVSWTCDEHKVNGTSRMTYGSTNRTNHSYPTIMEAGNIKDKGTTIYSIALQAGDVGGPILKSCASDETKGYFAIGAYDNVEEKLNSAFTSIAGSIAIAASEGEVTDPMSEEVDLSFSGDAPVVTSDMSVYTAGKADIYISQGKLTYDAVNDTIHWDVGNINEGVAAIMKYRVKLAEGVNPPSGSTIPTNKPTTFAYLNYRQEETSAQFPIPQVAIGRGTILKHYYLVNSQGKPINEKGEVVERPALAKQIQQSAYFEQNGEMGLTYGKYVVQSETVESYIFYGSALNNGAVVPDQKSVTVDLQATNSSQDVWFAYRQCFTVVHSSDNSEELFDYSENGGDFNITKHVKSGYLYGGTFREIGHKTVWSYAAGENPTDFTPEAGATYYLREVSDSYLRPKVLSVWKPYYGMPDEYDVIGMYLLTAIDDEKYYTELGFDVSYNGSTTQYLSGDATEGVAYDKVNTVQSGTTTSHTAQTVFKLTGVLGCSQVVDFKDSYGQNAFTILPYWITLDGVRVTGVVERTSQYIGQGPDETVNKKIKTVAENNRTSTASYEESIDTASIMPLTLRASFVATDEEPVVNTITVTKVENGVSTTVSCEPGDLRDVISYEELSDLRFAGWFTDADYQTAADLSKVESDITIYGKYVTDDYLDVHVQPSLGFGVSRRVSVFTPVDAQNYAEVGCRVVVNGAVLEKNMYKYDGVLSKLYLRAWFGFDMLSDTLLYTTGEFSARRGDRVTVQPYWVTLDGTTVYGVEQTVVVR